MRIPFTSAMSMDLGVAAVTTAAPEIDNDLMSPKITAKSNVPPAIYFPFNYFGVNQLRHEPRGEIAFLDQGLDLVNESSLGFVQGLIITGARALISRGVPI